MTGGGGGEFLSAGGEGQRGKAVRRGRGGGVNVCIHAS
jgi:hypothetical protein